MYGQPYWGYLQVTTGGPALSSAKNQMKPLAATLNWWIHRGTLCTAADGSEEAKHGFGDSHSGNVKLSLIKNELKVGSWVWCDLLDVSLGKVAGRPGLGVGLSSCLPSDMDSCCQAAPDALVRDWTRGRTLVHWPVWHQSHEYPLDWRFQGHRVETGRREQN